MDKKYHEIRFWKIGIPGSTMASQSAFFLPVKWLLIKKLPYYKEIYKKTLDKWV